MTGSASIQSRVLALVGAGVFIAGGLLSLLSRSSLLTLEREVIADQQRLAASVAGGLAAAVDDDLRLLATAATAAHPGFADEPIAFERAALDSAILHARLWSSLHFLDASGRLAVSAPAADHALVEAGSVTSIAERAIAEQRPVVSGLLPYGTDRCIVGAVPIRGRDGRPGGVAAGVIRLPARRVTHLLHGAALGPQVHIEVVDGAAQVIAAGNEVNPAEMHTSATAPVSGTPWSVVVSSVGANPLAPVATFRSRSLWLAPGLAGLATVLAWGIAWSVRRPIARLTDAAERIASGDLSGEVDAGGRAAGDEIARLAAALEHMRRALASSIHQIEESNHQLERRVAERTRELHALNARLEDRERLRQELLRKLISAQEDERKRVARELHDETSQTLAAFGIGVDTALAAGPPPETRQRLLELRQLVTRMHQELHRLIVNLRPSVLDDLGLAAAIGWFAARQLGSAGIAARCELEGIDMRLPQEIETALFRAVQECLVNISRHAQAESVLIQGSINPAAVQIEIEDDGIGFDLATARGGPDSMRGVGLAGMRERLEILGGTLRIESEPGHGTHVVMQVPLDREAAVPSESLGQARVSPGAPGEACHVEDQNSHR